MLTLIRIKTFIKSLFWHIYSGSPKSSQDQIETRYNICLLCDKFDTKFSICNICGCNINKKKQFLNKLAWADQECPIGKWHKLK